MIDVFSWVLLSLLTR